MTDGRRMSVAGRSVIVRFVLITWSMLTVSRAALCLWQAERVGDNFAAVMALGALHDLASLAMYVGAPTLLAALVARRAPARGVAVLRGSLAVLLAALLALEFITPTYVVEFDARPNLLFAEYLEFPREMITTLWAAYPLALATLALGVPVGVWLSARLLGRVEAQAVAPVRGRATILAVTAALVTLGGAVATLRPAAMTTDVSDDALVNSLPLNSLSSVLAAAVTTTRLELTGRPLYGDEARCRLAVEQLTDELRGSMPRANDARRDVVVVLAEGVGADVVGSLGGLDLSPALDALAARGVSFERLYATGTRSAHGLAAVLASQLPSAMRSLVKRADTTDAIATLGTHFGSAGYATSFHYGGDADFDHMARFVGDHGFATVRDRDDVEVVTFEGPWGVCDGDLFGSVLAHIETRAEPHFTIVFTNSNHAPWSIPDDVPAGSEPHHAAVRYADRVLGEFVDDVLARDPETYVLIVADHNARTAGPQLVPVESFHIPAVLLGPDVVPTRVATVASQIDLGPTLLARLGISGAPSLGRDLLAPDPSPGRAVMQFHGAHALLERDTVVVHRFGHPVAVRHLATERDAGELVERALGFASWPLLNATQQP